MSKLVHRLRAVEDQAETSKFILRYFFGPIMRSVAVDSLEASDVGTFIGRLSDKAVVCISTAAAFELVSTDLIDAVPESQDQEEWLENQQEVKMFQERVNRTLGQGGDSANR